MSAVAPPRQPTPPIWLRNDSRTPNDAFARSSPPDLGTDDIAVDRYVMRAFHDREMAGMWSRVWQMACHLSEIPEIGNYITYEIGKRSFIVIRTGSNEVKAFVNACLHRGMKLAGGRGQVAALTCGFHGWTWGLDGKLRRMTESWDFPQCVGKDLSLPEALTATWGGFVFINPDRGAEPFDTYIGELPEQFSAAPLENRKVAVHAARVIPANWKIAMDAFIEAYHVSPTHPESAQVAEYAQSEYNVYPGSPNISRLYTVSVAPVTDWAKDLPPQAFADFASKLTGREPIPVPAGQTYRNALAQHRREAVSAAQGESVDHLTDSEMLDAIEYYLFPNFMPWYGFGVPIAYRFRPNGDRHDSCVMEIYLFAPRKLSDPIPPAPATLWIGENEPFSAHACLGRLGPIFDQDYPNIVEVHKGLEATEAKGIVLGRYQESRIRHYHRRIDDYLAR